MIALSETIPARYTIIREELIVNTSLLANRDGDSLNAINGDEASQVRGFEQDPFLIFIAILIVILVGLLIALTLTISHTATSVSKPIYSFRRNDRGRDRGDELIYSFEGVKKILRSLMNSIKDRYKCPNCTAREAVYRIQNISKEHIKLYEDIMYGDRRLDKAKGLIDLLRRLIE